MQNAGSSRATPDGTDMTGSVSEAGSPGTAQLRYAKVWKRFVAACIDLALVNAVALPTLLILLWMIEGFHTKLGLEAEPSRFLAGMLTVVLWLTTDWYYNARMVSGEMQATLGKRCMGLKVTTLDGDRISFGQASGRHFAKFLSTFALFVGFLIAPFTRRKQALHDMVAGTLVIER